MAYKRYKRFGAKKTRKRPRYSRRYYRRRSRISHYKYSRGLRRFPKATEAKLVEFQQQHSWSFNQDLENENVTFYPGLSCIIPFDTVGINIGQGTAVNQRIGAKVKPIKLRLSGVLSYDRHFSGNAIIPESFHVRLLVYQVRGGNATKAPNTSDYHPLAMVTSDGKVDGKRLQSLFNYYNVTDNQPTVFTPTQMKMNMGTGKTPLRLGIGGQFKLLYTKNFVLSSTQKATIPFRIVTKVPNRLVWPENPNGAANPQPTSYCRNCIYAVWVVVPQTCNPIGEVFLSNNMQLFYIDK